jgi:hypothetical protein
VCGLLAFTALAGCGGAGQFGSGGQNNGNSTVVLAMMDSPPSLVTILSAEVTLTGATLSPGNVSVLSAPVTVELTRLQTDVAYLGTAVKIPAGSYTSVTLTFANPSLTIENDTGATAGCADLAVCKFAPTASTMSAIVPLTSFSLASSSTTGLLIDVNLDTLLNSSLVADFNAATTVFPFTPGGTGAPPVGAEDIVGHVVSPNASSNTFTLTNAEASYALKVDSSTMFFQFPGGATCPTPAAFSCLQANQILSVDIAMQSDGSLLARNLVFEDADSSDVEVEGVVTSTNAASDQFSMVVHTVSGTGAGLSTGQTATIEYAVSPSPFAIDFLHADNNPISLSTSGFLFSTQADLMTGQEVSIRRHATLAGGQIQADRVLLRSSRVTGNVQTNGSGILTIPSPSLISSHGGSSTIQAQTYVPPNGRTILFDIGHTIIISDIAPSESVSVRGPLFNLNNQRTLAASKVVVQP